MIYFLANGAVLGLAAGLSPGPLMALIITESLRGGWPAGFRVGLAPLVTDTVLVTVALLVAAPLPGWGRAVISVVGGGIIIWMGLGTLRAGAPVAAEMAGGAGGSLAKGIMTNLLNPQAFLFWLTGGGPILVDAYGAKGWAGPFSFMAPFFVVMIAINLILAFTISRGRQFLQGGLYRWALRGAGAMLMLLGVWRAWTGLAALL
ncbi:MAG TPA: LysE family transporter [Symbiobacteriaceae bacterium]